MRARCTGVGGAPHDCLCLQGEVLGCCSNIVVSCGWVGRTARLMTLRLLSPQLLGQSVNPPQREVRPPG